MSRRLLATAAAVAFGASLWVAGPSLAGSADPTLTITPTEGPPGTVITVTGGDCFTKGATEVDVSLFVPDGSSEADTALVDADEAGDWTAEVTVPADTTLYGVWHVSAICQVKLVPVDMNVAQSPELFEYDDADFTVPAPQTPPTTPPVTEPPAAAPVEAEADFTG